VNGTQKIGFEMKASETPSTTKSMRIAAADLKLERIFVIHPGFTSHELDSTIHVVALRDLQKLVAPYLES